LSKARAAFDEAIKQKPGNAAGWGGLALTLAITNANGQERPSQIVPVAEQAAHRALDIDPNQSDAHTALGVIKTFYEWDWVGAEWEYRLAIASNSQDANAHLAYAMHLLIRQRFPEALSEIRQAQELQPDSFAVNRGAFMVRTYSGDFDEAIAEALNAVQRSPGSEVRHLISMALQSRAGSQGNWDEVRKLRLTIVPNWEQAAWYDRFTAEARNRAKTREDAQQLYSALLESSSRRYVPPVVLAAGHHDAFGTLGDWPERSYQERDPALVWIQRWPRMAKWWESAPEYVAVRHRMGLVD
jgi:tetratricopeptide (TPR) repeat protein